MANYYSKCKSNYFHITDMEKFKDICSNIEAEDNDKVYVIDESDETVCLAFEGPFSYRTGPGEDDFATDSFQVFDDLQKILPDGECIIFIEIGWEKLRSVNAGAMIVTNQVRQYVDLSQVSVFTARQMLSNNNYEPVF